MTGAVSYDHLEGNRGQRISTSQFDDYCHTLSWTAWRPSFIVLHNTAVPSLKQRPNGLSKAHILALERYLPRHPEVVRGAASLRGRQPNLGLYAPYRIGRPFTLLEQARPRRRDARRL